MKPEFSSHAQVLAAWFDMLVHDHGIIRLVYKNFHQIGPNTYRSNQPAPHQIRQAAKMGIRTIVNLRGPSPKGHYLLEKAACHKHGIRLVNFQFRSQRLPRARAIHHARRLFERLDYPVLFHCKSGADRSGFASVLFKLVHLGRPLDEAMAQLSLRYGHMRFSGAGVLDHFFETYRDQAGAAGQDFLEWVDKSYDPQKLKREFQNQRRSSIAISRILRRE